MATTTINSVCIGRGGDLHVGGYDEVRALEKENKLKDLIK